MGTHRSRCVGQGMLRAHRETRQSQPAGTQGSTVLAELLTVGQSWTRATPAACDTALAPQSFTVLGMNSEQILSNHSNKAVNSFWNSTYSM